MKKKELVIGRTNITKEEFLSPKPKFKVAKDKIEIQDLMYATTETLQRIEENEGWKEMR